MILRVSLLVVTAVAAVAVSHKKQKRLIKFSEKDGLCLQQINEKEDFTHDLSIGEMQEEEGALEIEMEKDVKPNSNCQRNSNKIEFLTQDKEINILWNLVKELEQRKVTLERNLLELYGIKEQQFCVAQLQQNLEEKMADISMLNATIEAMQAEKDDLQKEINEGIVAEKQLEMAKKMMKKLQNKIDADSNQMKGPLMMLQEQVSRFQDNKFSHRGEMAEEKFKAVKEVELEVLKIRRENKELELEKRELKVKLVAAQAGIATLSNLTEMKIIANIEEELKTLRPENEELSKQVDRLQKNKFEVVEELVYQRWLNACFRFEIQNLQRKPSRICNISMNTSSISSCTSSTECENESSSIESSSSSQTSNKKKLGFIHNLKKWGRSKDGLNAVASQERSSRGNRSIRRFSTSMILSKPSKPTVSKAESPEMTPSSKGVRRVSFADYVTTIPLISQDMATSVENVVTGHGALSQNSKAKLGTEKHEISSAEMIVSKFGSSVDVNEECLKNDNVDTKLDNRIGSAEFEPEELQSENPSVPSTDTKSEIQRVHHIVVVLVLFCLILVAYFILLNARTYQA